MSISDKWNFRRTATSRADEKGGHYFTAVLFGPAENIVPHAAERKDLLEVRVSLAYRY